MFKIDGKNKFLCGDDEFSGVVKIAAKVCKDVERVTGLLPKNSTLQQKSQGAEPSDSEAASSGNIFFATLEKSAFAEKLAAENGLSTELKKISGKRERIFGERKIFDSVE